MKIDEYEKVCSARAIDAALHIIQHMVKPIPECITVDEFMHIQGELIKWRDKLYDKIRVNDG